MSSDKVSNVDEDLTKSTALLNLNTSPNDQLDYSINKLNLLAFPRNQIPVCELTGARATVELVTKYYTLYYASSQLAVEAWESIIHKIIHLFPTVFDPPQIVGTHEERLQHSNTVKTSKRILADFCMKEATNYINNNNYVYTIPPSIQALKLYQALDGDKTLSSVEPYLKLAQAYLGLKENKRAEEYVAYARWIIMNLQQCPETVRSQVHMLLGQVNTAQANYSNAKAEYSSAIYYSSKNHGPESLLASIGYFRLGEVFLLDGKNESALAFFDKVIEIWFRYLSSLRASAVAIAGSKISTSGNVPAAPGDDEDEKFNLASDQQNVLLEQLTPENLSEGLNLLKVIIDRRGELLGENHIAKGEAEYTLGLMYYFLYGDEVNAELYVARAEKIYLQRFGENNRSLYDVRNILAFIRHQALPHSVELETHAKVNNPNIAGNSRDETAPLNSARGIRFNTDVVGTIPRNEPVVPETPNSSKPPSVVLYESIAQGGGNSGNNSARDHSTGGSNSARSKPVIPSFNLNSSTAASVSPHGDMPTLSAREKVHFKTTDIQFIPRNEPVFEDAASSVPPSAILFEHIIQNSSRDRPGSAGNVITPVQHVSEISMYASAELEAPLTAVTDSRPSSSGKGRVGVPSLGSLQQEPGHSHGILSARNNPDHSAAPHSAREKVHFRSTEPTQIIPRNEPVVPETPNSSKPPSALLFEEAQARSGNTSPIRSGRRSHASPMRALSHEKIQFTEEPTQIIPRNEPVVPETPNSSKPPSAILFEHLQASATEPVATINSVRGNPMSPHRSDKIQFTEEPTQIIPRNEPVVPETPNSSKPPSALLFEHLQASATEPVATINSVRGNPVSPHRSDKIHFIEEPTQIIPRNEPVVPETPNSSKPPSALLFEHIIEKSNMNIGVIKEDEDTYDTKTTADSTPGAVTPTKNITPSNSSKGAHFHSPVQFIEKPTEVITREETDEELHTAREKPPSAILFDNMLQKERSNSIHQNGE